MLGNVNDQPRTTKAVIDNSIEPKSIFYKKTPAIYIREKEQKKDKKLKEKINKEKYHQW